jgi:hypothetical protein
MAAGSARVVVVLVPVVSDVEVPPHPARKPAATNRAVRRRRAGTHRSYERALPGTGQARVIVVAVSTRRLIIAALLCGLAILVAFSIQLLMVL